MKKYLINEIFYSLQGEGVRMGTANIFIRFAGCNQDCKIQTHGFDCDTEFQKGEMMSGEEIAAICKGIAPHGSPIVWTGGEPALQLDAGLIAQMTRAHHNFQAIETNGSIPLTYADVLDWITVSPKVPEEEIKQGFADEVKYVIGKEQALPSSLVAAQYYLISPAYQGDHLDKEVFDHCMDLCLQNPRWRLSPQMHKMWNIK